MQVTIYLDEISVYRDNPQHVKDQCFMVFYCLTIAGFMINWENVNILSGMLKDGMLMLGFQRDSRLAKPYHKSLLVIKELKNIQTMRDL